VTLRITGIVDAPVFLSDSAGGFQPNVFVTRAFYEEHQDDMAAYPGGFTLRLRNGAADVPAVERAVREMFAEESGLELSPASEVDARIEASIDVVAGALLLTALIAAVTGVVAIAQAFGRHLARDADGQRWLAALGMTPRQRHLALAIGVTPAVIGGAVLAVVVAIVASPLMPVGVARRAEPDPGVSVDGWVLALGFAGIVAIVALLALLVAIPASRAPHVAESPETDRAPSRSMRALRGAGLAPPATIGVGMALDPRDGTGWSVRSALAGFAFGITGLVAVIVLAASLATLVDAPARYGTPWDSTIPGFGGEIVEQLRDPLLADPAVERLGVLSTSLALIDGVETNLHAVEAVKGTVGLTLLAGRPPAQSGEVVLGSRTMERTGTSIGDVVEIDGAEPGFQATVVGRAVFPVVDERSAAGRGALLWPDDLTAVAPEGTLNHDLVVAWADGVDVDAASAALSEEAGVEISPPRLPSDVNNLQQVEALPRTLAIVLAALALLVLLHALLATTRSRRRDLAVLRTLGFQRRQLSATIAWQATTIAGLGVLAGGCLGLVVGRMVWSGVARSIGVVDHPTVPMALLIAIAVGALLAGNLAATIPARAAGRVRPATVLRAG
jgi:putative ABC transport system permease protein